MPTSAELIELLSRMASELAWLAVAWHVAGLSLATALALGWRPPARVVLLLLAALASSVAVASAFHGNFFNGTTFGALAVTLVVFSRRLRVVPTELGPRWALILGAALLAFGWFYPHFNTDPWYRTLYAAPLGVVPCPTLAAIAGAILVVRGFRTRAVPVVLAAYCAFYAVFGILRLGVLVDAGLVVAALGLLGIGIANGAAGSRHASCLVSP